MLFLLKNDHCGDVFVDLFLVFLGLLVRAVSDFIVPQSALIFNERHLRRLSCTVAPIIAITHLLDVANCVREWRLSCSSSGLDCVHFDFPGTIIIFYFNLCDLRIDRIWNKLHKLQHFPLAPIHCQFFLSHSVQPVLTSHKITPASNTKQPTNRAWELYLVSPAATKKSNQ